MAGIPQEVLDAWETREGPVVLTTVDGAGVPNSIYATCVGLYEGMFLVADNYFDKTRANIQASSKGAILFITADNKAYQLKGTLSYHTAGPVYDNMKTWNPEKHPGHAAAALAVEAVFSGAEKLM